MTRFFVSARQAAVVACGGALLALAACAAVPTAPTSDSAAATRSIKGEPIAQYALPEGQRLFYQLRPGEIERLDFDVNDQRVARQMAQSRAAFAALAKNGGDLAAVQLQFGPPAQQAVQEEGGLLWTYSWLEYGVWRLARLSFDKTRILQRVDVREDTLADDRYR